MSRQLEGKVALITGAGRGIGEGIARIFVERGAQLALSDISESALAEVTSKITQSSENVLARECDVTDSNSVRDFVETAISHFGQIDICVPNAGVIGAAGFQDRQFYTDDDWELTYDVNVRGLVKTTDAVVPHMKDRQSGKIINIASHGGRAPRGIIDPRNGNVQAPYAVSKAAVIQWTHLLAIELGPFNINVNAVCPGRIWTPIWEKIALNHKNQNPLVSDLSPREIFDLNIKATMPLGTEQTPEDIGKAVAFLASDDASQITGQALNVNGGAVLN